MSVMSHMSIYVEPNLNTSKLDDRSGHQYAIQVLNDSKDDIVVMHRDNIPFQVRGASLQLPTHNRITIRTTYTFYTPQAVADTRNLLHDRFVQMKQFVSKDSKIIYDILMSGHTNHQFSHIKIDRIVSVKDLQQQGCLYINDLDIMLYYKDYNKPMVHPYSEHAIRTMDGEKIAKTSEGIGIMVQIVDNDEKIARRFGYMCNKIVEVPIIHDESKQSGIYVHHIDNGQSSCIKHDLSEMEALGLYPSEEEAATNGKPDLIHQKEMLELKKKLDIAKAERDRVEVENNARITAIKEEHEEYMREQERKRYETKDHYEERSYSRKNDYESLKVGAAALAIVLSIVAIAKKA